MFGNKELKERIELLEFENRILSYKINEIMKQLKPIMPMYPLGRIKYSDGSTGGYDVLREKYRSHEPKFNDGL